MPSKLKLLTFAAAGLILGAMSMWIGKQMPSTKNRYPAQSMVGKRPPMGKHLAPIQVAIVPPDELPTDDDQEVKLTGLISVAMAKEMDLTYEWELPQTAESGSDIEVIQGHLKDGLANVKAGQTVKVELILKGFSQQSLKHIALKAYYDAPEGRIGNAAAISSRPQDSFEYIAPSNLDEAGFNPRPSVKN